MPIVIFGTGQLADVAYSELRERLQNVQGFVVDDDRVPEPPRKFDLPVVGMSHVTSAFPPDIYHAFAPISYSQCNIIRKARYERMKHMGYHMLQLISHDAVISRDATIGDHCWIQALNVIQPFATVGDNTIMWSSNHVGHHTTIGPHAFIASGVTISGNVTIGERCFFGVGSCVRDGVTIGNRCVIGMGAVVTKDVPDGTVMAGARGRVLALDPEAVLA